MQKLLHHSVTGLSRLAGLLTLIALAIMSYSVVDTRVLPVMVAMSLGHVIGATGFGCFFLAIVIDAARAKPTPSNTGAGSSRPPTGGAPQSP
jgi:hypothetical protein